MERSSPCMLCCGNRRDAHGNAPWRRPSASWAPHPPQRPKQAEDAATEKRSMGANGNAGLTPMGACCACSSIRRTSRRPKARSGLGSRIIHRSLGHARFGRMMDAKDRDDTLTCHGTHSPGAANTHAPQQTHLRNKRRRRNNRRRSLSWFSCNPPESALSEAFVCDHALRRRRTDAPHRIGEPPCSEHSGRDSFP